MYIIRAIRNEADYHEALARIKVIFQAQPGTSTFEELEILVTLTEAYEIQHHPIETESGVFL